MTGRGDTPDAIAEATGRCREEIVLRLVELRLGPLGRVRPIPESPSSQPFKGDEQTAAAIRARTRQAPVLRLAARVLGPTLQRLGDRVFLNGDETDLPTVVHNARARGEPIHYPGIAPLEAAMAGGPSPRRLRARRTGPHLSDLRP